MYAIRSYYALAELGKDVSLAGFRKGHAPKHLVEKSVDQNLLQSRVMEAVVNDMYIEALVITSYSIHYTKLYEPRSRWWRLPPN